MLELTARLAFNPLPPSKWLPLRIITLAYDENIKQNVSEIAEFIITSKGALPISLICLNMSIRFYSIFFFGRLLSLEILQTNRKSKAQEIRRPVSRTSRKFKSLYAWLNNWTRYPFTLKIYSHHAPNARAHTQPKGV